MTAPITSILTAREEKLLSRCIRLALSALENSYPCLSVQDAEDIVQDLVVAYLESWGQVKNPKLWFPACATRRANRVLLKGRRPLPLTRRLSSSGQYDATQFLSMRPFMNLRPESRTLLSRLFVEGFTLVEIAKTENRSLRSMQRRARKSLEALRRNLTGSRK